MSMPEESVQVNGQNNADQVSELDNPCYNGDMVEKDDYAKLLGQTIQAMENRLAAMRTRREQMAAEVRDLDDQIAVTQQDIETAKTIWQRSPFSGAAIGETKPLAEMGMTAAIEYVLSRLMLKLSPTELRDKMEEWGFDFSSYQTTVISSISSILRRLVTRGLVHETIEGHRRKAYKWIGKKDEHSV